MKWMFWIFLGLYAAALLILMIGLYGWFGQEKDPLSAVFLIPLGLPWNILADALMGATLLAALLSPAINAAILLWLWRR